MKKKILVIGPGMEIGGVERSLLGLLDAIDYDRFDVDLFLFWHQGEFMPYINRKVHLLPECKPLARVNLPIAELVRRGHWYTAALRLFSKLYADRRAKRLQTATVSKLLCHRLASKAVPPFPKEYDFALGFFLPHDLLNDKVKAKVKIGWVHTDYTSETERPDTAFMLPMWRKLDYIACVSEDVKRTFCSAYPSLAAKTVVIANILSSSLIQRQAEEGDASAEMPDDGSVKLLSVGRFCTQKAFDRIPRICRELVLQGYPIKWYLIGYGPDEQLIRTRIRESSMEDCVMILGRKTNPYPYMKACDLYVQPSRYEGRAVTVTEAQMLHKPVLITRYATSAAQLKEGVDGFICEQGEDGVVEGIRYLLDHPAFSAQLAENAGRECRDNSAEIEKVWALHGQ